MSSSRDPHAGTYRLLTLGSALLVDGAGTPVAEQRRRIALLALVACHGERGLSRDKLIAYLSPERTTDAARHALHQLLYYLRQQVGDDVFLGTDPLRLNTARVQYDVATFDTAYESGALESAVALYRGPFLDGFHLPDAAEFDAWASSERARLAARHRSALLRLARAARERGDPEAAAVWSRTLSAADPFSVPAALEEMRALAASGDRAGALRVAQAFQQRLHDEFGSAPDTEVDALAAAVRAATRPIVPAASLPLPTVDAVHTPTGANAPPREPFVSSVAPPSTPTLHPRQALALMVVAAATLIAAFRLAGPLRTAAGAEEADAHAIAMVPLENLAGDSVTYLAQGVENTVRDALQRIPTVRVTPPSVMQQYDAALRQDHRIAQRVGATVVLRSRLIREQDTLRWVADIVNAEGTRIGGGRFTLAASRLATLEADILDTLAMALRLPRVAQGIPAPRDGEVYLLVMQAAHFMLNRDAASLRRAHALLTEAIERDPAYAEAYGRLSGVYGIMGTYGTMPAPEAFELSNAAARRALELDPTQTMAMANLAHEQNVRFWRWAEGERALRHALALEPWRAMTWNMLGTSLRMTGRFADAREAFERARSLDPLARHYSYQIGHVFRCAGQLDSAQAWLQRALVISPGYVTALEMLADVQSRRGHPDSALASWRAAAHFAGDSGLRRLLEGARGKAGLHRFLQARARRLQEQTANARDSSYLSPLFLASLSARTGDSARAFTLLERAAEIRDPSLPAIACMSDFIPLREAPRFRALMRRLNLTSASYGAR